MTPTIITAAMVQALRARTGAGMMDCKRALESAEGDLDVAAESMRKSGQIQAEKKSGRIAAEGLIVIKSKSATGPAVILEVNCETDFVARDENFKQFAEKTAQGALDHQIANITSLLDYQFADSGESVEKTREALVAKLGENIQLRRFQFVTAQADIILGSYVHRGRIGTIVQLKGGDEQLAKDLALHIIANNPAVISADEIAEQILAKEREIIMAQSQGSGKPQAVIEKMVEGRLNKFRDEMSLLGQAFVKDPNVRVGQLLESTGAKVISFVRFAVGEGIEKPIEDFAEAVMAQVKNSS
ncbi:MAG: translation elongation factor Ts [Candidatus Rickettsiella isopodorum]|nr:translation elongation factor Ts [Gammaproteobacteria bacterium]MCH9754536.1 translation elongation factor Ts [Gammaproteobacteria bacterium]MDD4892430.1 translation elongation factor Ts [Candidatus Rickettsiella isopodorum]MDD5162215.1 translation elongation factor Ts [Candidatus Rickettsiella isopodorum]MDQ5900350.1 elongation factor Ts [Pseudomonadota bacterium]